MNAIFELVDTEGDPIAIDLIKEGVDLPVKVRSIRIENYVLVITLEYLHGGE